MDDIYYSVEYIKKGDVYDCWNQFSVSRFEPIAKLLKFECKRRYGKNYVYRIREV